MHTGDGDGRFYSESGVELFGVVGVVGVRRYKRGGWSPCNSALFFALIVGGALFFDGLYHFPHLGGH